MLEFNFKGAMSDNDCPVTSNLNNEKDWKDGVPDFDLDIKKNEIKYQKTINNIIYMLENHPTYKGKIRYDEFTNSEMYDGEPLENKHIAQMRFDLEKTLGFYDKNKFKDALEVVMAYHSYNSLHEFIRNVQWDGKPRMRTVFIDAFNVEDTAMHREMIYKWFLSGIVRAFEPGYPIEGSIILTDAGGTGKSFFCNALACGFGNATSCDIDNVQRAVETLKSNWIVNFDELSDLNKTDMNRTKRFLTECYDTVRLAYKEKEITYRRHNIFIGSTNEETFLRDYTNDRERRFWILKCNVSDYQRAKKYLEENPVEQIWAEAYNEYLRLKSEGVNIDLSLDGRFNDEMRVEQQQFKTSYDDDNIEKFKEILEGLYYTPNNSEEFACEADFVQQTKTGLDNSGRFVHQINKIPVAWVTTAMGVKYKSQKLKNQVVGEWEYKLARYGNMPKKCWCRKEPVEMPYNGCETTSYDHNELPF